MQKLSLSANALPQREQKAALVCEVVPTEASDIGVGWTVLEDCAVIAVGLEISYDSLCLKGLLQFGQTINPSAYHGRKSKTSSLYVITV